MRRTTGLVDRAGASHAEKRAPCDVEHLATHQMKHRIVDTMHRAAMPPFDIHGLEHVEILVVAVHEKRGERLFIEPAQPIGVFRSVGPHQTEVSAYHQVVVLVELTADWKRLIEPADLARAMRVARDEDSIRHDEFFSCGAERTHPAVRPSARLRTF